MWLLSADNDLLGGKRIWLRPGTVHLFGRTTTKSATGERIRHIDERSISRRHLLIEVENVRAGSSAHVYEKAKITVTDTSKSGSYVNGEKLHDAAAKSASRVLDAEKYEIRLGSAPFRMTLLWVTIVLSFTNIGKGAKSKGTALAEEKKKLEGADIKLVTEYLSNETTHVVAKKRNTAAGLQALVQARWIVSESYVNELEKRMKPSSVDEHGNPGPSLLEDDFDGNWPDEKDFIVPTGGEPVVRPNHYYVPDPTREVLFANYIFLFLTQSQYDTLMPVVTGGGGKAVILECIRGQTTKDDISKYCKELLGKSKQRRLLLSQEPGPGGVVVVLPQQDELRTSHIMQDAMLELGQRFIEQREFLDAILTGDLTNFRMPIRDATQSAADYREADTAAALSNDVQTMGQIEFQQDASGLPMPIAGGGRPQSSAEGEPQARQEPVASLLRRRRRVITQPKSFADFDDFDPKQIVRRNYDEEEEENEGAGSSQTPNLQEMNTDESSQHVTQRSTRKRPASTQPEQEEETEQQMWDRILPGIAAAKRRKTEALKQEGDRPQVKTTPTAEPDTGIKEEKPPKRPTTKVKDKEVLAHLKAQREAEDERRQKDEEANEELRNSDINELMKDYSVNLEVFDLPLRPQAHATRSKNPEWKGRPNFKKFRSNKRRDNGPETQYIETQRVIIPVQIVPSKGHGFGDEYWLDAGDSPSCSSKHKSQSRSRSQSQSYTRRKSNSTTSQSQGATASRQGVVTIDNEVIDDDEHAFRRRIARSREDDREDEIAQHVFDEDMETQTSTLRGTGTQKGVGKRPIAGQSTLKPPPAKRQATQRSVVQRSKLMAADSDDDDDDPTAFRRKRR